MISAIRSSVGQIIIKLFLLVIVLSFVVWGIGDIFRGGADNVVAEAGSKKITTVELSNYIRQQMEQRFQNRLTSEQMKQMGIHQILLGEIIRSSLLSQEINRLGMNVGDRTLVRLTQQSPYFRDSQGNFDKQRFQGFLANQGLSEANYFALLREEAVTGALMGSLVPENISVSPLVERLHALRGERRRADIITFSASAPVTVPAPTEAELQAYWKNRQHSFVTPEYRQVSYVTFTQAAVPQDALVSDADVKAEYESRLASYEQPEKRDISNMVFATEDIAQTAYERLKKGEEFAVVARAMLGMDEKSTHLGVMAASDLMEETMAEPVFALKQGEFSKPLKSNFGWHIMRVNDIQTAQTASFEQVKEALRKELQSQKSEEGLYRFSTDIEDALAGGATLEEVAQKFGLKVEQTAPFNKEGRDSAGRQVAFPSPFPNFVELAFSGEEGVPGAPELSKDYSTYITVRVDKVTASKVPELAAVKAEVIEGWKMEQSRSLRKVMAMKAAERLEKGEAVSAVGGELNVGVTVTHNTANYPGNLISGIFAGTRDKPTPVVADQMGDYYVAIVREITPAPKLNEGEGNELRAEVQQGIQEDIRQQYLQAVEKRYPVEVHDKVLERAL